jgi:uncharacterized protein YybS (DUF2232 family)
LLQNRLRSTLEGAFTCGIFLVFMFLALYTPLSIIPALALPVPFTVYAARHDVRRAVLVMIASCLLTFILGALPSVISALFAGLLGIVMGTLYRLHKKATVVFLAGLFINLAFFLGSIVVSFYLFGINPVHSLQEMMKESLRQSESIVGSLGATDERQIAMLQGMVDMIPKILPMLLVVGSAQMALINHWLSRKVLRRLGMTTSAFPPFREWKWPRSVLFYYIFITILSMTNWMAKSEGLLHLAILNLKPIFDLILLLAGLSFIFFYAYMKKWGKGIPILAIILVFLFPLFPFILILLGIFDLGFNLRTRVIGKS